jgi:hypothetical protein
MRNTKNVNDGLYFGRNSNSARPELKSKVLPLWATLSFGLSVQLVPRLKQPEDEADRSSVFGCYVQNLYLTPPPHSRECWWSDAAPEGVASPSVTFCEVDTQPNFRGNGPASRERRRCRMGPGFNAYPRVRIVVHFLSPSRQAQGLVPQIRPLPLPSHTSQFILRPISVGIASGLDGRGSIPGREDFSLQLPDRFWRPPSLYPMGTGSFHVGKSVGA